MKKYTVLAAAIAMVAFAGCNKEENNTLPAENGMVTLTMTGENYSSADKQNYNTRDQFIEFSQNEACYANGFYAPLTLLDQGTLEELTLVDATSRIARISVPEEYATLPFTILYPADAFQEGDAEDFPQWNCPMRSQVEWIRENQYLNSIIEYGFNSSWPMAAVVNQGGYGSFQLRNCVAVLTPAFKFTEAFLTRLAERFPDFVYDQTMADNATIKINSIVLTSDVPLSGDAHVDFTGTYPTLVMDNTENASNTLTIVPYYLDDEDVWHVNNQVENILGNVAVAPMHTGNTLKMDVYFTVNADNVDYDFVYNGNTVTLDETPETGLSVLRSMRTTISANFASVNGANKVSMIN